MEYSRISLILSLLLLLTLGSCQVSTYELHVSVNGNDANPGTVSEPFASIEGAQKALHESGKIGRVPCKVFIHEGTYRINESIRFGINDGGTAKAPVVYCAAQDEKVTITGAQTITSEWELWQNGIHRTRAGELDAIDQLFVNGKRQHMARYPNFGAGFIPSGEDKSVRGKEAGTPPFTGCTPDAWDAEKAKEWKDPTGAFLHGMHKGLWGSQHYVVLGKTTEGNLLYEGGWQNNRSSAPHQGYRMIENVFEELDAPGEWFHDKQEAWVYYKPALGIDINAADVEAVLQIKHLIELYGKFEEDETMDIANSGNGLELTQIKNYSTVEPLKYLSIQGIRFTGTARTVLETKEPLLRSDWCVYRGGAIHLRGTENITIENCSFEELGGNAVFVDGYNREVQIRSNYFSNNGSNDVNFVGSFAAVRDPAFSYGAPARPLNEVDTIVGPKSEEYPADCLVEDNLMNLCGRFEKQACGINISMSSRITLRYNTISHTPRAAINICDGTWGGHLIEWNDCFETVLETHDHGAFNSWGRDRYWHSAGPSGPNKRDENGKALISFWIEKYPNSPLWDAYQTTIIRNNRMQCDHGWDIDLDDGSSNYEIYNNICLSGGLKTREGYHRVVTNNVILGRGYTCNVPYPKPTYDIFERNILWGTVYRSTKPLLWGGTRNYNFVHNPDLEKTVPAYGIQEQTQDDAGSLYGNALFTNPNVGDFTVDENSDALKVGYKNFSMTGFGVFSTHLLELKGSPQFKDPETVASNVFSGTKTVKLLGAQIKSLNTEAEVTATGMHSRTGALLVVVPSDSEMAQLGFNVDDVVLEVDGKKILSDKDLIKVMKKLNTGSHTANVWRNQSPSTLKFEKI